MTGFVTVYSYFNIPLMVLITLPAIDGLKTSWREACANLGGTSFTYWRRVGLPVLAAVAARRLPAAVRQLVQRVRDRRGDDRPVDDRAAADPVLLRWRHQLGQEQLGFSLAAWMILIMIVCMGLYWVLRKTGRAMADVDPERSQLPRRRHRRRRARRRAPPSGVRPAPRPSAGWDRSADVVLVVCGLFFVLPLVAMARFSLQNVPMVQPRLVDAVRQLVAQRHHQGVRRTRVPHVAVAEPQARRRHRGVHAGAVAADHALGPPAPARRRARSIEFLTVLPYVIPPIALVAGILRHQAARAMVPQLRLLADPVLHGARAAVHVPGARRRHPGDRRQDARRRVAQPRRGLGHHAAAGH